MINHTYLSSLRTTTTIPTIIGALLPYRVLGKCIRTSNRARMCARVCARFAFFTLTFNSGASSDFE